MEHFSYEETLMFLGMYSLHPGDWGLIVNHIKDNDDLLPDETRDVYRHYSDKKLKRRLRRKLHDLMNMPEEDIHDTEVRERVIKIKEMESISSSRHYTPGETTLLSTSSSDDISSSEEEAGRETNSGHDLNTCKRKRRHESSSSCSDATGTSSSKNAKKKSTKKKRKKSSKKVKKESSLFNNIIINTVSSIFRSALGVTSSSSDSSD